MIDLKYNNKQHSFEEKTIRFINLKLFEEYNNESILIDQYGDYFLNKEIIKLYYKFIRELLVNTEIKIIKKYKLPIIFEEKTFPVNEDTTFESYDDLLNQLLTFLEILIECILLNIELKIVGD